MADEQGKPTPIAEVPVLDSGASPQPVPITFDEKWLESFYRECGREITLAYTTLNQMKNWAILTAAAAISGLAFGTGAEKYPSVPMFTGTVIVYMFVLRFFIRAAVCYSNLVRWNKLQYGCLKLNLVKGRSDQSSDRAGAEAHKRLEEDIRNHYYLWLSPLSRKSQLIQNLKLGFMLLFTLVLFFMIWGMVALWREPIVRGLAFWAFGVTLLEFHDFAGARIFDNVEAYQRKKARSSSGEVFPVPSESSLWYLIRWTIVLLISILIASWPQISPLLGAVINSLRG